MGSIRVGAAEARPDMTAHVRGARQGNAGPNHQPGHHEDGTSDARRSTGVHWKGHNPILGEMPNISPA
jgi:hypothetical protein